MADLIELLERVRPGYEQEQRYHRLLIDAYEGTGGFASTVVQAPAGFWGPAAESYSNISGGWNQSQISYLDRFHREDDKKFKRRLAVAHYANYIAPLTDTKVDFMLRKPFNVEGRPPQVQLWREDVDGNGTTWDEIQPDLVVQAATVGYIPAIIDMPPGPVNPDGTASLVTRAAAEALGLRPTVIPLLPANLRNYQCDPTGMFIWANIRTDHQEQLDAFGDPVEVTVYTIWYRDRFKKFEVRKTSDGRKTAREVTPDGGSPHAFEEVPIAILRNKKPLNEPVRGIPMHGQETMEARRLFNVHSELDEHMRSQVFALLVIAAKNPEDFGKIITGNNNGIPLDPESAQAHYYLSPDASIAEAYEKRAETIIQEIYRQARIEFTRPDSSKAAVSGVARKFEFAQTDRALAAYAAQVARFEEHVDWLVGKAYGISEDTLAKERITPPTSFDVDDLQSDLQLAIDAVTQLAIGPTAEKMVRQRIIDQLLPNMTDEQAALVDAELDEIAKQQEREAAANEAIADAFMRDEEEGESEQFQQPQS